MRIVLFRLSAPTTPMARSQQFSVGANILKERSLPAL
jgi:hypothetical protein